ncbi:hypothetical protein D3C87_460010 [compost metagenome]
MDTSSLLRYGTGTLSYQDSIQDGNGSIEQTERLFTVRPRNTTTANVGGGDRGTRAKIRLLTNDAASSLARRSQVEEGLGGQSLSASGSPLDNAINGNNTDQGYADFFVTDVRCQLSEKLQITEVYGDGEVAYYFGRQPIMMTISGFIFDSFDNSWFVQWLSMYGQVMRGTQLAKNYELLKLILPNMYVIGSIASMDWAQSSARDQDIQFSFQFLVKEMVPTAMVSAGIPTSSDAGLIDFSAMNSFIDQTGINSAKAKFAELGSSIQNPASTLGDISSGLMGMADGLSSAVSSAGQMAAGAIGSVTDALGLTGGGGGASATGSAAGVFSSISANLSGVRASLFAPIYGVLSSLTKLVKSGLGAVSSIFNALTSPVRNIIRDIRNISNMATGIVNLVNNSIKNMTGQVTSIDNELRMSLGALKNAAGVISSAPMTITQNIRGLVNAGHMPVTAGFLQNKPRASLSSGGSSTSKIALLNSGAKYTAQSGAFL